MPVYATNGIVLHRINLGETDKIVTLFTREHGKLNAVAKGARRVNSKLSGATELFIHARLLLAVGKSLDIVSQCEVRETFSTLRNDLALLARGTYLCELTDRLVEEREPNPEIFDLLLSALYLLQRMQEAPDVIVHAYELRLLSERGYAPKLDGCVHCGQAVGMRRVAYSPSLGGALCGNCHLTDDAIRIAPQTLDLMRQLAREEPETLITLRPDSARLQETHRCLRWHIRYRSERDLKSAEFLEMLRAADPH